ncbi:MAG: sulfur carrier protein ThiS [Acidobacteriota bacterium]|nr:sulfur carrier protein ThiS [Acidobacteriota bacterium]
MFQIVVNGESRTISRGETLLDVIRALDLEPERVAVELDRRIVKKTEWAATEVSDGAHLEIVQFVGGG